MVIISEDILQDALRRTRTGKGGRFMDKRDIVPNEQDCISQCIFKFWSNTAEKVPNRDESYERCLTNCNVCGSA